MPVKQEKSAVIPGTGEKPVWLLSHAHLNVCKIWLKIHKGAKTSDSTKLLSNKIQPTIVASLKFRLLARSLEFADYTKNVQNSPFKKGTRFAWSNYLFKSQKLKPYEVKL
jgi:hypothetical protein